MDSPRIESRVVRPRRERRAADLSNLTPGTELSSVGSPTKEKERYETQADLVPVDTRDHLGLFSTT
jgi:hypothetical protein